MLVTKNGVVHKCNTEERYRSFIASGWEDYTPPEAEAGKEVEVDKEAEAEKKEDKTKSKK